jgi:hypothetical protein
MARVDEAPAVGLAQQRMTDDDCFCALVRDRKWPRVAQFLHIHQSARMLSKIASISDLYLEDFETQNVSRVIFLEYQSL